MPETTIKSYKDLIVWQKGYELVKQVYKVSSKLPQAEVFALQSQMRRSAVSIVSNIAEGSSRKTRKDYCQFLHISYGSASELETQLFLSKDLYALDNKECIMLLEEVSKMLRSIISKLEISN